MSATHTRGYPFVGDECNKTCYEKIDAYLVGALESVVLVWAFLQGRLRSIAPPQTQQHTVGIIVLTIVMFVYGAAVNTAVALLRFTNKFVADVHSGRFLIDASFDKKD